MSYKSDWFTTMFYVICFNMTIPTGISVLIGSVSHFRVLNFKITSNEVKQTRDVEKKC